MIVIVICFLAPVDSMNDEDSMACTTNKGHI